MKNKAFVLFLTLIFASSLISAIQVCSTYDDFSSGALNLSKWEIRQDVEGQPLMEEYAVIEENGSSIFHTRQNVIGDRRVYLFPKINFTTGDSISYEVNLISKEGNHGNMVLLLGDQYIRIGMRGTDAGFDELGIAYMNLSFSEDNLHIERTTPSNNTLVDNLQLDKINGTYQMYIGSFSGHNGLLHMDYDNFILCSQASDSDNDRVIDSEDLCPNTFGEQKVYGCSCKQILDIKPGPNKKELENSCSDRTINFFTEFKGWAKKL